MITDTSGVFKTEELPDLEMGQSRYIMAASGLYYEQNDDLFHACSNIHKFYRDVNFGSLPLLDQDEFFIPRFPIIPQEMVSRCLGFFQAIEDKHGCECGLVLLYDPDKRQYAWHCPQQEISGFDLSFTMPLPGKDYAEHLVHFGDVHLHPNMAAYHSSTDYGDEMTASDGLHIVVGTPTKYGYYDKNDKWVGTKKHKAVEFCATFTSDGARFKIDPAQIMELTDQPGLFPPSWLKQCTRKKHVTSWLGGTKSSKGSDDADFSSRQYDKEKSEGGWKYGYGDC